MSSESTLQDITVLVDAYRECVRHLWNAHFLARAQDKKDWHIRHDFNEAATVIFRALVLRPLDSGGRGSRGRDFDGFSFRTPSLFLRVVLEGRSAIMVNREKSGEYWDHPPTWAEPGEIELALIQFYDWNEIGFCEFALYRVRILSSERYPECIGRDALVPVNACVRVYFDPTLIES
jgi:hypothetical protein